MAGQRRKPQETITIEGARIIFRNFEGREQTYNREGDRNFCVLLDQDVAAGLYDDKWAIKVLKPREGEEGEPEQPYLPVAVKFGQRPPKVVMISSRGRTDLHEQDVKMLDFVDIENVDLVIRPYDWEVSGKSGRKAYLKSIYVTIAEDDLDRKYADVQEIGAAPVEEIFPPWTPE